MSHATVLVAVSCDAKDIQKEVERQMEPFYEGNSWFANGSRWDWWVIGGRYNGFLMGKDFMLRKDLDHEKMLAEERKLHGEDWDKAIEMDQEWKDMLLGNPPATREQFIAARACISFYAFLKDRQWHENSRMGWFGGTFATECQIEKQPHQKCVTKGKKGAKIVTWNDPEDRWDNKFWPRFIKNQPPNTYLVVVDYHV